MVLHKGWIHSKKIVSKKIVFRARRLLHWLHNGISTKNQNWKLLTHSYHFNLLTSHSPMNQEFRQWCLLATICQWLHNGPTWRPPALSTENSFKRRGLLHWCTMRFTSRIRNHSHNFSFQFGNSRQFLSSNLLSSANSFTQPALNHSPIFSNCATLNYDLSVSSDNCVTMIANPTQSHYRLCIYLLPIVVGGCMTAKTIALLIDVMAPSWLRR